MSKVKLYNASDLDQDEWRQLQGIERDAFAHALDRSRDDIDALVEWDNSDLFYKSHIDPNSEVGKRYNFNNLYTKPKVAIATEDNKPIGFAYSAHNVWGGGSPEGPQNDSFQAKTIRQGKRLSVIKNYLWLREIAVQPEYQRQGVAKKLGQTLLKDAINLQPIAAYAWPDADNGFMQNKLEQLRFFATGEQQVNVFGEASEPVRQVRMQASSVRAALKQLS